MKKENYTEMKTEDLQKGRKTLLFIASILTGMLIVLFVLSIFVTMKQGKFSALTIIPFALSPILIINFSQAKLMKKELDARKKVGKDGQQRLHDIH